MSVIKCVNRKCPYWDEDKLDFCGHSFLRISDCPDAVVERVAASNYKNPYLEALFSTECVCGGAKKSGRSVCYQCWSRLSENMQNRLYLPMGDGYEEAYEEAVDFLENG